ncbi:NEAT domain-containing protein [Eupransor demetentiae]|uniref:Heme-binding NEAT domain (NEAT) n=1 Tax=Eupransor demetentiae TaxID=3109584 RepID=A0ABP0EPQ2_9LACO|nr:Heme-binding NEAT domain (NEAT) [Lactobacillaceae bacterium LMG 33000]
MEKNVKINRLHLGKMWLAAGAVALGLSAGAMGSQAVASADDAAPVAVQAQAQAPAADYSTLADGQYNVNFSMDKYNTDKPSVMAKIIPNPASAVVKGDNVTLTFNMGGSSFGFAGDFLSSLLKSWTFNGVAATRDGANWTVTLPKEAMNHKIDMQVSYFMTEKADLYINGVTEETTSPVVYEGQTNETNQAAPATAQAAAPATVLDLFK